MARQVNGHLGTFGTIAALTARFPPEASIGCSANVGTDIPYTKAWCDGNEWALVQAPQIQSLVSGAVFSGITYDAQGRVVGYALNGAAHTIEYPNSVTVVLSNDSGSRTVGLDASGLVVSIA